MSGPSHSTVGSAIIRRLCAFGSLLAIILQGSTGGHMLLVEHVRCAEHGDLVHSGEGHAHQSELHTETEVAAIDGGTDSGPEDAHEHCAMSADRRDAPAPLADAQQIAGAHAADATVSLIASPLATTAPLYRLAPKNSPPA